MTGVQIGPDEKPACASPQPIVKNSIMLFVLFVFISSDIFVDNILCKISSGFVNNRTPTIRGVIMQGAILVLIYIVLSQLSDNNYL
jgi:hypothetical protein